MSGDVDMPEVARIRLGGELFSLLSWGDPRDPSLYILHGFPDTPRSFHPMATALVRRGFHVVAPWMRGYHPSPLGAPAGPQQLVRDTLALIDVYGVSPDSALIGHDWGAIVAGWTLCRIRDSPLRSVSMAVPALQYWSPRDFTQLRQWARSAYMAFFLLPTIPERALRAGAHWGLRRLWRRWSPGFVPDTAVTEALIASLSGDLSSPLGYYRRLIPSCFRQVVGVETTPSMKAPTLHLHGGRDGCIGAEFVQAMARRHPEALSLRVQPRAGHFLQLESPGWCAEQVEGWCRP